jgi:predicted enzyme related to lactoylglutathione lyase
MKTGFLGLRTVIYRVDEIEKGKQWYSKVFGMAPYFDEPFYVGFNVGGYELGLQPAEGTDVPGTGGVAAYWGVDDVQDMYKMLLDSGASSHEEPAEVGGGIVVAAVKDPWGNLLGIIYNPHFKLP